MFADEIKGEITVEAYHLLSKSGVGSHEEMVGLLVQFPSIARGSGISLPSLSNIAAAHVSTAVMSAVRARTQNPVRFAKGSFSPPRSSVGNGYQQPPPPGPPSAAGGPTTSIVHLMNTPVRDQGQRGTCVAHAVVACAEGHFSHQDLSEQFKYWAAKRHGGDPFPDEEGTWLRCARNALASHGVCEESLWQYNPNPVPGDETQEVPGTTPSSQALQDAASRQHKTASYKDISRLNSGKAAMLAQEINNGPVAVALPVFVDILTDVDNWSWTGACDYGHVIDPPQFSVVDGGHAVCVCEYHPSTAGPGGGWFIFKNSWGMQRWSNGSNTPPQGHPQWKAGYGYLSAAYMDEYLWEFLRM